MTPGKINRLRLVVGIAAVIAPLLHSLTDAMEWYQSGFSLAQLWLNYIAFLPMPWLLLGIYMTVEADLGVIGLGGALLYGIAFTYFAHTTLYALASRAPNYESMWQQLGITYTVHGALMVIGGLAFAWAALRTSCVPTAAVWLFISGLIVNLVLAVLPAPDVLQTIGTTIRNAGLVAMGWTILRGCNNSAA